MRSRVGRADLLALDGMEAAKKEHGKRGTSESTTRESLLIIF